MKRRSFFTAMLGVAAVPVIPSLIRAVRAAAPVGISPALTDLIDGYKRLTAAVDALDPGAEWEIAADARMSAVEALLDYQPANLPELVAKMDALQGFAAEDVDLVSLQVMIDDARKLAEVVR